MWPDVDISPRTRSGGKLKHASSGLEGVKQRKQGVGEGCAGGGMAKLRKKLTMKGPLVRKDSVEKDESNTPHSKDAGPGLDPFKLRKITPLKRFVGVISMPPSPFDLGFDKRLKQRRNAIHKYDKIMSITGVELQRYSFWSQPSSVSFPFINIMCLRPISGPGLYTTCLCR